MKRFIYITVLLLSVALYGQNKTIDDQIIELTFLPQDSIKVDLSVALIEDLYEAKEYGKALKYVNATSRLAKELNYSKGLASTSYQRGLLYSTQNDYYNAIDNFNKARVLFARLQDTLGVAQVSNGIGVLEIKRGNYKKGLSYTKAAIKIFEDRNLSSELGFAYTSLGEAYLKNNQFNEALNYNLKALQLKEQLNDFSGIKKITFDIARLYSKQKDHRKAISYYSKLLELLNLGTDLPLRGKILANLGSEYLKFNDIENATQTLTNALKYNRDNSNKEGLMTTLHGLAKLNILQKKVATADSQLNEALIIARQLNDSIAILENYKLHIDSDSTGGYYQDAFIWQNRYYNLKDELERNKQPKFNSEFVENEITDLFSFESNSENSEESSTLPVPNKTLLQSPFVKFTGLGFFILLVGILIHNIIGARRLKYQLRTQQKTTVNAEQSIKAIEKENQNLKDINQVKDKLFSIVSHDLKDSVSAVKSLIDLLKDDGITTDEFKALIPQLSENANNASALLFNLLNWSKSQLDNLEPKPEMFNIREIFTEKLLLMDQKAREKGIQLVDKSQTDFVFADRNMVEIIIQNLLSNAVKFTNAGGKVTISNTLQPDTTLICIEDTGVGISDENISKLFNANKNFTTIGTKNEKGTGLGLTIAKDLVELNNGKIWVQSTINVGTKFFIELPKTDPKA